MITDFKWFGSAHIIGILIPLVLGMLFILLCAGEAGDKRKRALDITLAILLIVIRGSRYIMDVVVGRFDFFDLFSLHICHIDLILLVICLIKPNRILFQFVFLVGIPMGLAVALFPGSVHPEPGLARAVLFIMSHMMLVVGALYLCIGERMKPSPRAVLWIAALGQAGILGIYVVNRLLHTNYLYLMAAPEGTVIESLERMFGWPGYIVAMDLIALALIGLMYVSGRLLSDICLSNRKNSVEMDSAEKETK